MEFSCSELTSVSTRGAVAEFVTTTAIAGVVSALAPSQHSSTVASSQLLETVALDLPGKTRPAGLPEDGIDGIARAADLSCGGVMTDTAGAANSGEKSTWRRCWCSNTSAARSNNEDSPKKQRDENDASERATSLTLRNMMMPSVNQTSGGKLMASQSRLWRRSCSDNGRSRRNEGLDKAAAHSSACRASRRWSEARGIAVNPRSVRRQIRPERFDSTFIDAGASTSASSDGWRTSPSCMNPPE